MIFRPRPYHHAVQPFPLTIVRPKPVPSTPFGSGVPLKWPEEELGITSFKPSPCRLRKDMEILGLFMADSDSAELLSAVF